MTDNGDETGDEVVCEFFGIKITTKNPNIARVLTADLGQIMAMDVSAVRDILVNEPTDNEDEGAVQEEPGAEPAPSNEPGDSEPGHDT